MNMVDDEKVARDRAQQQRRSLGCAVWAILLALFGNLLVLFVVGIVYNSQRGTDVMKIKGWLATYIFWLVISLLIFVPTAALIGWLTKEPADKKRALLSSAIASTFLFMFLMSVLVKLCEFDETGPRCIPLTETPITLLSAVVAGILIGIVAGYGYWRAGRNTGS